MHDKLTRLVIPCVVGAVLTAAWMHVALMTKARDLVFEAPSPNLCPSVVINEVAWGGTQADPTDEWIELVNMTAVTVELDGWRIVAADGSPDLSLAGAIAPYGFYLIERTADTTVADIPADLVCTFGTGLTNAGEQLELRDELGHLVDTVNVGGTAWPNSAGLTFPYPSMERITPASPDVAANWVSNDGSLTNGIDAAGNPIAGTPRSHNAAYQLRYHQHADLTVALSGPHSASHGSELTYLVQIHNRGGATATDVLITAALSSGLSFVAQDSPYPYALSNHSIIWTVGDLAPDARAQITLRVLFSTFTTVPFNTTLHATSPVADLNPCDNAKSWTTRPETESALRITMEGPATLTTTEPYTYHLTIENTGAEDLAQVRLIDILPESLHYLYQISPFPASHTSPTLTWQIGTLPAQTAHSFTVGAQLDVPLTALDLITNTVEVRAIDSGGMILRETVVWTTSVGMARVVIGALLYDGYQLNDTDEAVNVVNVGTATELLDGWMLCKATSDEPTCIEIPTFTLHAGDSAWLTNDAEAFRASFGFVPDIVTSQWRRFSNSGDAILLRAPGNRYIDTLVYKSGNTQVPGWYGEALQPYRNQIAPETGQILSRRLDEETGLPSTDTDTALDWMQSTTNPYLGRRATYPGWDTTTLFQPLKVTETATVIVGIAPDNAFEVILETLMGAQHTISIEVYSLRHLELGQLLAAKAQEGVQVTVLLEGSPVGIGVTSPEWQTQLHICEEIEKAGGACWFMAHHPEDRRYNRYPYLHAKLLIVDDQWVAIGSQNLTPGGLPSDDKSNGTAGTRGVIVVTDAPSVVQRAAKIFRLDFDPGHHSDLVRWNTHYPDRYGKPIPGMVLPLPTDGISYTVRFSRPFSLTGTFGFELFTAPEAALRQSDALLGILGQVGAGDRVYVQQLYEYAAWGADVNADPNLRLQAYLDAARRGAHVRILLNGHNFADGDPRPPQGNLLTLQTINALAAREHLDLRASTGTPTGEAMHNKMVLVGLNSEETGVVHIGSLNGSETANKLNREIVLQISSVQLYTYLKGLFIHDWSVSNPIYLPLLTRNYAPLHPAQHIVISEVAYATSNPASEWVELYNPTRHTVDLSNYKLGDAESPAAWEPMFRFPAGTSLPPDTLIVVAVNASHVPGAHFEFYDSDPTVPDMQPYTAWGSTAYPFALRDLGDQVLLLDEEDQVVDVVVWGDRTFPGTLPHLGVVVTGASLERYPAAQDTDDCAVDFRERYPPTPGRLPD